MYKFVIAKYSNGEMLYFTGVDAEPWSYKEVEAKLFNTQYEAENFKREKELYSVVLHVEA